MQPLPDVTSQIGEPGGSDTSVVVLLSVVVLGGCVVVVLVLVVLVLVLVVDVLVDGVVVVDCIVLDGQSFHPSSVTDVSEYQVMTSLGVTPSGPSEPSYTTPSTVNLS